MRFFDGPLQLSLIPYRSLQSERTTIHRNLTFCLLIAEVFFLAGISQTQLPVGCHIFSVFMHYFFLATFMWCLFDGLHLYLLLVEVFEPEKSRRMWYYLAGYGVPLVVVSVCLGVDWTSYATAEYCWLRADNYFILGFVIPVGLTVIANLFFLSVALYFMCKSIGLKSALHARDPTTYKQLKTWICAAFGLVFVMAATWIFGFMYLANLQTVVFAYVFTFLNSFQGVLIFFLLCYKNEKVKTIFLQFFSVFFVFDILFEHHSFDLVSTGPSCHATTHHRYGGTSQSMFLQSITVHVLRQQRSYD